MICDLAFIYNCIIMILSILGAFLASSPHHKQRLAGYVVWLVSNGAIAVNFYYDGNWPMVATFFLYEIFNIRGIQSNLTRNKETNNQ